MGDRAGPVQVIVVLTTEVARDFGTSGGWHGIGKEIEDILKDFGLAIQPLHPGSRDPTLARYFVIDRIDASVAHRLATRLRSSHAVESVYVKVPGETP